MAFEQYLRDDSGAVVCPESDEEWREWVSASRTRNFAIGDPLLDWLNEYGRERGFVPDDELPGYDERTDFGRFIMGKGLEFEAAVVRYLETRVPIVRVEGGPQSLDGARETWTAMLSGAPLIHQAVLRNPESRTYGAVDLLVRSDVLHDLFPDELSAEEAAVAAPTLGGRWHYRVIDIKFSTLHLDRHGHAGTHHMPFMVQTFLYNAALGRIQGFTPPASYLLGRGWEQGKERGGDERRGSSCMERLGRVDQDHAWRNGVLAPTASDAVHWVRRLRQDGGAWDVLPRPTAPELWPNMKNREQGRWHGACSGIATELDDLSLAWFAGEEARDVARASGISRWTDPRFDAASIGMAGGCNARIFDRMLEVNRDQGGDPVRPAVIRGEADRWGKPAAVEFFVDFETVNSLDDDFRRIPEQGGQPLIFMIGCGHIEAGEWSFASFTAESLSEEAEARIIEGWLAHMEAVRARLAPGLASPLVFHWSPAEASNLSGAFGSARVRHPGRSLKWAEPNWYDFLGKVMKDKSEPVVLRGALGFGLKAVGRALHSHGLIATAWGESITDGMGAMTAAWQCAREAIEQGVGFPGLNLMHEVRSYNEVDCRVMMEAIEYFRGRAMRVQAAW